MQYTIASNGRPIGTSDLGFVRICAGNRSGWFYPNDYGERLMPLLASPVPATRAYIRRHSAGDDGVPLVRPGLPGSTMLADLAESRQYAEAFQLTLHREDGSLIPVTDVSIANIRELLELSNQALLEVTLEEANEVEDPEIQAAVEHDIAIINEWFQDPAPWTPEAEEPELPPYQIHVRLVDPSDVP